MDPSLVPFWRSRTMHGESIRAEGCLLFAPDAVLAVTNAAGDKTYTEGADYVVDCDARRIMRPAGSRMPAMVAVTSTYPDDLWTWRPAAEGTPPRVVARLARGETVTVCLTGDSIAEGYDVSGFHRVPPNQPAFGPAVADLKVRTTTRLWRI